MFFQTCIRLCGPLNIEQGSLYSQRGKVGSVHLVDDECSLFPADTATLEKDVQDEQEGIDKTMEESSHRQHPVQHMLATCSLVSASHSEVQEKLEEGMRKVEEWGRGE